MNELFKVFLMLAVCIIVFLAVTFAIIGILTLTFELNAFIVLIAVIVGVFLAFAAYGELIHKDW